MSSDTRAVAPSKDANGNKGINNCTGDNGTPVPTILELAKAAGLPLSSAYRHLALLREVGLVEEEGNGVYRVTPRAPEGSR